MGPPRWQPIIEGEINAMHNKPPVRLIACDIDGTLLQNGAKHISPEIFEEIHRLEALGILFCPASGRQYHSLRQLFAPAADKLPYLCENGAILYGPGNPGPVLGKTVMDRALAEELSWEILAIPGCEVLISGANTSYLCPKEDDIEGVIRDFTGNNIQLVPRPEAVPEDIIKVSSYCRFGAAEMEPVLAPRWSQHFRTAVAGDKWLDFTLADKGSGLEQLCAALDLALEEVMAFGDNFNDVPMLRRAGRPWLMASAAPELRAQFPSQCQRVEEVLCKISIDKLPETE